jgi:hypothetical protein
MNDLHLITVRRGEVSKLIASHRSAIAELEAELVDLETAGKVIARLSGEPWPPSGAPNTVTAAIIKTPVTLTTPFASGTALTMPEMIIAVLTQAHRQGLIALTPKEMSERIREKFAPADLRGDYVASIAWRTAKQGRIVKIGDGRYSLPEEKAALDLLSGSPGNTDQSLPKGEKES